MNLGNCRNVEMLSQLSVISSNRFFFCQSQKFLDGHIVRSVHNWCEYVCSVLSRRWRILGWILTFIWSPSRYGLALLWSPEVADDCVFLTTFHVDACTLKEASKQVLSHQCILLPSVSVKKTVERLCDVFRNDDSLWAQMPKAHPVSIRSAWWDNSVTLNQTQTSSSEQKRMTPPYPSYCKNTTQHKTEHHFWKACLIFVWWLLNNMQSQHEHRFHVLAWRINMKHFSSGCSI